MTGDYTAKTVPVRRAELVTRDMDMLAELIRELYFQHTAAFGCPDPARADGQLRAVVADGLSTSVYRYGGFTYTAETEPVNPPMAIICADGSGTFASGGQEVRMTCGDVFMMPSRRAGKATEFTGDHAGIQVPWEAARALAEETAGIPAAALRFDGIVPVSAGQRRVFALTAQYLAGALAGAGGAGIHALVAAELTRLAAAAFLETFPNTTMTVPYLPGPGWTGPARVRRAAAFIDAHAGQPVTVTDIAAASGVSIRALQNAFRAHYGITPAEYLRRARLERAHLDLRGAEPGDGVTVGAVAARWGWASPSQFAAAYRQRFGQPPSRTLRT